MAVGRCKTLFFKGRSILKKHGTVIPITDEPECCISCHEDTHYGYDLCSVRHNNIDYDVCCRLANWWNDNVEPVLKKGNKK